MYIDYTPRCRSVHDLHHRGLQARGGVRNVRTEPIRTEQGTYTMAGGYYSSDVRRCFGIGGADIMTAADIL